MRQKIYKFKVCEVFNLFWKPTLGMFKVPDLTTGPCDLSPFRMDARDDFLDLLSTHAPCSPGDPPRNSTKALVLDSNLGGILNLIIPEGTKTLKKHGVQYFCDLSLTLISNLNFPLPPPLPTNHLQHLGPPPSSYPSTIIFLVRPLPSFMPVLAAQIKRRQAALPPNVTESYTIVFAPSSSLLCESLLEKAGAMEFVERIKEVSFVRRNETMHGGYIHTEPLLNTTNEHHY